VAERSLALLVEDDPDVRKVVRRSLIDLGFAVVEAESGTEAMTILDHTPQIDLLLSDVVMPGPVDGREGGTPRAGTARAPCGADERLRARRDRERAGRRAHAGQALHPAAAGRLVRHPARD
jgi:CheY-like chemotaxis protein